MAQNTDPCKLPMSQTEGWQEHRKNNLPQIYKAGSPPNPYSYRGWNKAVKAKRSFTKPFSCCHLIFDNIVILLYSILLANPQCLSHSHADTHLEDALNTQG